MTPSEENEPREELTAADLRDVWMILAMDERLPGFRLLPRGDSEDFFLELPARDQAPLLLALPPVERKAFMRLLPPDDAADVIQATKKDHQEQLLSLLDVATRKEVNALLAYEEDTAAGLMSTRFGRLRADMTADEAITYLRKQVRERIETIYYVYVLDEQQRLLGVVSFRELFAAPPAKRVRDIMHTDVVTVREDQDQESVSRVFAQSDLMAIPVLDVENRIKGIVTVDDIVDVVQEEATEDIQKFGGMEALDEPYLKIGFVKMLKKRGGWLSALFLGEMLTTTAMAFYEHQLDKAVVLAMFIPLIISSGGNSGSQASTLVIRAMALGEVRLRDWWRVVRRELFAGLALGVLLAVIGFVRILVWQGVAGTYGEHYLLVGCTIALTLLGVVTLGTLAGSILPLLLQRLGLDPASASAPFVATLVDVAGIMIYFTAATLILTGTIL